LGRLKSKVSEYIASGMQWDNMIKMFKLAAVTDAESLRMYCSFYIIRTFDILAKTHSDFSLLTKEEKTFFVDSRHNWVDIFDLEQFWHEQITERGEDNSEKKEKNDNYVQSKDKGCGIM